MNMSKFGNKLNADSNLKHIITFVQFAKASLTICFINLIMLELEIDYVSRFKVFFWDNLLKILLSLVVVGSFVLVPTLMTTFYDNNSIGSKQAVAEKLVRMDEKVM